MKSKLSRLALVTIVALSALLTMTTSGYGAGSNAAGATPLLSPTPTCAPDYDWTSWGGCRPIQRPCPAGKVDVNGNGVDDGDCENLDTIARPDGCLPWPGTLTREGYVECGLRWSLAGRLVSLINSVGCVEVIRTPYPRAMVNVPTRFSINGIIPPNLLGYADGQPGSYRYSREDWTVEGQYLHERYPAVTRDSNGLFAFDTRVLLGIDPYKYPSINNVRAYLKFKLITTSSEIRWTADGFTFAYAGGVGADAAEIIFKRASFPLPGQDNLFSYYGPNTWGANVLPAFKVNLRTRWQLILVSEWDNYYVNGSNQYTLGSHTRVEAPMGLPYDSYRAWDSRQSPNNTGLIYCNAAQGQGYIPVPVIEGQSVLKP